MSRSPVPLLALFTLTLGLHASASGQCVRGLERSQGVTALPGAAFYVDLNRDGLLDVVIDGLFSIEIQLNRANAIFETIQEMQATAPSRGFARIFTVADVDGDAVADLVLSHDRSLLVFRGNRDGTFSTTALVWHGTRSRDGEWVATDVNGDGRLELVVLSGRVFVIVGVSEGQLAVIAEVEGLPFTPAAASWAAGDFDGDGRSDLVVAAYDPAFKRWEWFFHWSDGAFAFTRTSPSLPEPESTLGVSDIDGDGTFEIATTLPDELLLIDANRTTATAGTFPITYLPRNQRVVAAVDFDDDGRRDIVFEAAFGAGVIWGSDSGFAEVTLFSTPQGSGPVAVGDINGDRIPDLLHGSAAVFGTGSRALVAPRRFSRLAFLGGGRLFRTDVDGDGRLDDVVAASGTMEVFPATDEGFGGRYRVQSGFSHSAVAEAIDDFDGDGYADVASNDGTTAGLPIVYFGGGPVLTPTSGVMLAAGKFRGAIVLEPAARPVLLVQTDRELQTVAFSARRSVEARPVITLALNEQFLIADVDGDSDSDLILMNGFAYRAVENRGGTWMTPVAIPQATPGRLRGAVAADVDGDGRNELLLWSDGAVKIYDRTATGYSERDGFTATAGGAQVLVTDWDRDGLNDLVTLAFSGTWRVTTVQVLRNERGRFVPIATAELSDDGAAGYVTDFDSDGWPDVVVLTQFGMEVVRNVCAVSRARLTAVPLLPLESQPVTLLATGFKTSINPDRFTGTMTFRVDSKIACEVYVEYEDDGVARCTVAGLSAGVRLVTASFDDQYAGRQEASAIVVVASPPNRRRTVRH